MCSLSYEYRLSNSMKSFAHLSLPFILSAALAACGGGGSSTAGSNTNSSSSNPVPVNSAEGAWLTFSPAAVDVTQYQGDTRPEITITGTSTKVIEGVFNVAIIDTKGVLQPGFWLGRPSLMQYSVGLYTAASLPIGTHTTNLEVRMCRDDPKVCNTPISGSPWYVPFKVTIRPDTNLSSLRVLPQLSAWKNAMGNNMHTSYVPGSFDVAAFSRRWKLAAPSMTNLTNDGGLVFATQSIGGQTELVAISEDTGSYVWRTKLGDGVSVGEPAPDDGRLYVTGAKSGFLWSLDQKTGAVLSKVSMDTGGNPYYAAQISAAPTVVGQDVYVPNPTSYLSGLKAMGKFSSAGSRLAWNADLPGNIGHSPAVDANYAYVNTFDAFVAVNLKDGTVAYRIRPVGTVQYPGPVVLAGSHLAFFNTGSTLEAFNLSTRTSAWSQAVTSQRPPAYANNVVYASTWNGLQARAADSGRLLWSSEGLSNVGANVLVTDNLAFVSSNTKTLAIDLRTGKTVWSHPNAGSLSISNRGVLYINSARTIDAINLQ